MSRLRRDIAPKVSFFAFQDIITSVSGILILVVLILATDLETPTNSPAKVNQQELVLEQQLDALMAERNRVVAEMRQLRETLSSADDVPSAAKLTADISDLNRQIETVSKQAADATKAISAAEAAIREQDLKLA